MLTDCESRRARRESAAEESLFNLEGVRREIEGDIAQLGERLPCKQEVAGSIPTISTNEIIANRPNSEQSPAKRVCEEEETQRNERDVLYTVRRVIWSLCRRTGP